MAEEAAVEVLGVVGVDAQGPGGGSEQQAPGVVVAPEDRDAVVAEVVGEGVDGGPEHLVEVDDAADGAGDVVGDLDVA